MTAPVQDKSLGRDASNACIEFCDIYVNELAELAAKDKEITRSNPHLMFEYYGINIMKD